MTSLFVDLHTHTIASDGTQTPTQNVHIAKAVGLAGIAITDHDTVAGLSEAMEAGRKLEVIIVPGVEISTISNGQDIHILGYCMDYEDPKFLNRLAELRQVRDKRNEMMIDRLQQLGMKITLDEVVANLAVGKKPDETLGRPHIAGLLVKKGYVQSIEEAFEQFLGNQGTAFVNPPRIEPCEAIRWIHEAGGTAVIAHPGIYQDDALVTELVQNQGLDGIEAYHSDHTSTDVERYSELARQYGLFVTAGSDFHGKRNGLTFHGPIGSQKINIDIIHNLQRRSSK